ncbi:hypothetical protein [Sodalis sp. C49]|uniref:hypothetical protein n=1 Tax=unclassified Sodalis (in: enterobacteria) TaxID=2636512 RepID=UPI003965A08F
MALVYGFANVRNLDSGDGVTQFTLDQLNQALGITTEQLDYRKIRQLRLGVAISRRRVRRFTVLTGIDGATAKMLLMSWRDFLRDNYDFISVKSRLLEKIEKCRILGRNCECAKNILLKNSPSRPRFDDGLWRDTRALARKFIRRGDVAGFKALRRRGDKNRPHLAGAIKTMLLRRIIKLGLEWSNYYKIMVNFDVNFRHQTAMKIEGRQDEPYWPLTYSAYRYCQRQLHDHVSIRIVPSAYADTTPILRM